MREPLPNARTSSSGDPFTLDSGHGDRPGSGASLDDEDERAESPATAVVQLLLSLPLPVPEPSPKVPRPTPAQLGHVVRTRATHIDTGHVGTASLGKPCA